MCSTEPPGYPKTQSTFSSCRHLITISAPLIIILEPKKLLTKKDVTIIDSPPGGQGFSTAHSFPAPHPRKPPLAAPHQLTFFLETIERRAFKQAVYAVRDEETALDIVQDSMMKLAEKYGDRPAEEFPMLFQRILQNTIRDHYRRSKVRALWTTPLSSFASDDEQDPLETLQAIQETPSGQTPENELLQSRTLAIIEHELKKLPTRQREAFVMRYWEEMDVAETASAMGCSEGSVKTHCSRATHTLAAALAAKGIKL